MKKNEIVELIWEIDVFFLIYKIKLMTRKCVDVENHCLEVLFLF